MTIREVQDAILKIKKEKNICILAHAYQSQDIWTDSATPHKHDSQDICFVQNGRYTNFIRQYTGQSYPEGNFTDTDGNVLGTHKGIIHYTVGQHRSRFFRLCSFINNLQLNFPPAFRFCFPD